MNKKLLINLGLYKFQPMLAQDTGDNGGGSSNGESGTDTTGTDGTEAGKEGTDKTFDDILKDKKYQSEFDKKIAKALETAKSKWEADYNSKLETAKTEAEKLAKMNADQKAEYEQQKRLDELVKREKDITARELRATTLETLAEKNLPGEFTELINYDNAENCNESIELIEKIWSKAQGTWQEAVEKEANKRLRGGQPPKSGQGNNNSLQEQISKAMRGQI